jgi:hypothetical protein
MLVSAVVLAIGVGKRIKASDASVRYHASHWCALDALSMLLVCAGTLTIAVLRTH